MKLNTPKQKVPRDRKRKLAIAFWALVRYKFKSVFRDLKKSILTNNWLIVNGFTLKLMDLFEANVSFYFDLCKRYITQPTENQRTTIY